MNRLDKNRAALQDWLTSVSGANSVEITATKPLTGGAIQENWQLDFDIIGGPNAGTVSYVLRSDAPSSVASSLSRSHEFKVLQAAHNVGVTVPEPLWLCEDTSVLGSVFYIMQRISGVGLGPKVVKDETLGGDRDKLGGTLARELARIHTIRPPHADLAFLSPPAQHPAKQVVARLRKHLDALDEARPVIEWGLRWAELNLPPATEITLIHNDFRTGNYLLDGKGLTGILDWEFTEWGDPMCDIGWFCAKCWRFSRPDLEAGGITDRATFYAAYETVSDRKINPDVVYFWEVIAHIRWAVIALEQAHRFMSGGEKSIELALIGRLLPNLEAEILAMTKPEDWRTA